MKKYLSKETGIFAFYLILYLIIGIVMLVAQPFGNPPDEYYRFLIPNFIYKYGTLPTGFEEEIRIYGYGFSYGFQPILPYIFHGYAMRLAIPFAKTFRHLLYAARSVNLIFGFFTAIVTALLAKTWFSDKRLAWIFAFLATFLPQSIFLHTYVNTDSCCMLSIAIMLHAITLGCRKGFTLKIDLYLSVGIILCALSYYNAYGYILSCILLFIFSFLHKDDKRLTYDWKGLLRHGILISAIVLAGIGWWFIRSAILYNGDFLGLKTRDALARLYAIPECHPDTRQTWQNLGYNVFDMLSKSDFFNLSVMSFIAMYGPMELTANIWLYRFYKYFFLLMLICCIVIRSDKTKKANFFQSNTTFGYLFYNANLIFCLMLPIGLSIWYSFTTDYQPQGRYMMPSLLPIIYFSVKGLEKLWYNLLPQKLRKNGLLNFLTVLLCGIIVLMMCWMLSGALPYFAKFPK